MSFTLVESDERLIIKGHEKARTSVSVSLDPTTLQQLEDIRTALKGSRAGVIKNLIKLGHVLLPFMTGQQGKDQLCIYDPEREKAKMIQFG